METRITCDCGTVLENGTVEECKSSRATLIYGTECSECGQALEFEAVEEFIGKVEGRLLTTSIDDGTTVMLRK